MHVVWLAALAIGPCLLLVHVAYAADRHDKEPKGNIAKYALLGGLAALVAVVVELVFLRLFGDEGPLRMVLFMFLGVAVVEEGSKMLCLWTTGRRDPFIDEPFDWIVYAVTVSLGFATLENIAYVVEHGASVGLVRAFTAVPQHALLGTLMGDRLARAALASNRDRTLQTRLALVEPALWHGAYDTFATATERTAESSPALAGVFVLALLASIVSLWIVCVRRVLAHRRAAPMCLLPPVLFPLPRRLRVPPATEAPAEPES